MCIAGSEFDIRGRQEVPAPPSKPELPRRNYTKAPDGVPPMTPVESPWYFVARQSIRNSFTVKRLSMAAACRAVHRVVVQIGVASLITAFFPPRP